ncbi:GlsB/YeaQ/YmgE family stress response membrane protein [Pediococcus pentosaceus]|uniref:GlsB/YeaQ/YmgE family stress response membrane protein n=1 Tax=Pediococcus pentosaceus TaxID=1255 RepID=UPI00223C2673|nr:GlsB/YeaQ/YmgE family stress response membrane protein [Pediococcus pentosaceus]MCS8573494.1 GlsB/YeaQ/YmgE family stress response membrane protein [Pediococcus pentosaceus]
MGIIWTLIVGAIIGAVAGALTSRGAAMGWISNILAGLIGSWLGESLLGNWGPRGPSLAGMALVPSIIGAVILVIIVSWITTRIKH